MTSSSQTICDSKISAHSILSMQKPPEKVMLSIQNTLQTLTPQSASDGTQVDAYIGIKCKGKHQAKECMSGQQAAN